MNERINKWTTEQQRIGQRNVLRQCHGDGILRQTVLVRSLKGSNEADVHPIAKQTNVCACACAHMFSVQGHSLFRTSSSSSHINNYLHLSSSIYP
ncbi:hypothetical protein QQG55_11430 [Brugia pahangi]|uniref:Transposase n=1 Tax=Brugia pahangi TaxID=6280 RepID=A0A0N4T948_BRUPA|nr:unnamed protein product [Brugia pahangi]